MYIEREDQGMVGVVESDAREGGKSKGFLKPPRRSLVMRNFVPSAYFLSQA